MIDNHPEGDDQRPPAPQSKPTPTPIEDDDFDWAAEVREDLPNFRKFLDAAAGFGRELERNIYVDGPDPEAFRAGRPGFPRRDGAGIVHRAAMTVGRRAGLVSRSSDDAPWVWRWEGFVFAWGLIEADGIHLRWFARLFDAFMNIWCWREPHEGDQWDWSSDDWEVEYTGDEYLTLGELVSLREAVEGMARALDRAAVMAGDDEARIIASEAVRARVEVAHALELARASDRSARMPSSAQPPLIPPATTAVVPVEHREGGGVEFIELGAFISLYALRTPDKNPDGSLLAYGLTADARWVEVTNVPGPANGSKPLRYRDADPVEAARDFLRWRDGRLPPELEPYRATALAGPPSSNSQPIVEDSPLSGTMAPPAGGNGPTADGRTEAPPSKPTERLITLDQAAALVNRKAAGLRHYRQKGLPSPKVEGRKGQPNEYALSEMVPWLERTFNRRIPESAIRLLVDQVRL